MVDELALVLKRPKPGLGGPRKSRAEEGGGGSGPRPGLVVGTEGKVGEEGCSVGTEGNAVSFSFSSSIEGKSCANSDSVRVGCKACREPGAGLDPDADGDGRNSKVRGDEPVEDVGDGGPNDAVDTNVWGEESGDGLSGGEYTGRDGDEGRWEMFDNAVFGNKGGGREVVRIELGFVTLKSRENRFVTPTDRPWS